MVHSKYWIQAFLAIVIVHNDISTKFVIKYV